MWACLETGSVPHARPNVFNTVVLAAPAFRSRSSAGPRKPPDGRGLGLAEAPWPDGAQRPLPPLGWLESLPLSIVDRHVKKRQEWCEHRLQDSIQSEDPAGHLFPDVAVGV